MVRIGDKWEIDNLNESNWPTWKFPMKHLLIAKEVWKHVDVDGSMQPPGQDVAALARHVKTQQKAMATLVTRISPSLIYLVTLCTTPMEVWDTLKAEIERNTLATVFYHQNAGRTVSPGPFVVHEGD